MTLGVDALKAKWMLAQFLDQNRSKDGSAAAPISATFCVIGETTDPASGNAQIQLRLVREAKLEQVKGKLDKVLGVTVYRSVPRAVG